jgi:hypothetical protein
MPPDDASAGGGTRRNGAATRRRDHVSMSRSAPPVVASGIGPIELRLVVWVDQGSVWHARVSGPGIAEREFVSPFELARFVAWPLAKSQRGDTGLR